MAALDFPSSPTVGQIHPATPVADQSQYQWNGTYWIAVGQLGDFVKKSGDTMSGVLTVTPKGSLFGSAGGAAYNAAVAQADANIRLYTDGSNVNNWCGLGADTAGNFWLRVGTSGAQVPALMIASNKAVSLGSTLAVTGNVTAGGTIAATGGISSGALISGAMIYSTGYVQSNSGRVVSYGPGQPSLTMYSGDRGTAYGFWNSTANTLSFGHMGGDGTPSSAWGQFYPSGDLTILGTFRCGNAGVQIQGYLGTGTPWWAYGATFNVGSTMNFQGVHYAGVWAGLRFDAGGSGGPYFDFRNDGNAYSQAGGAWVATSDARAKTVRGDYTSGLAEIVSLHPVRFVYRGNNTYEAPSHYPTATTDEEKAKNPAPKIAPVAPYKNSPQYVIATAEKELVGLLAQEAELSMPELVMKGKGHIDGVLVDDLRDMNTTPLVFALINAVKELKAINDQLAARVAALEAAA